MKKRVREAGPSAPLPPMTYHVLIAMSNEAMHGYAIIQAFERLTEGRETLLPGSLYATLARMEEEGLVRAVPPPRHEASAGPARQYFKMTAAGCEAARRESDRRARLLAVAAQRGLAR